MKLIRIVTIAMIAACVAAGIYVAKPQTIRPHTKEVHLRNIRQLTFGRDAPLADISHPTESGLFTRQLISDRRIAHRCQAALRVTFGRFIRRTTSFPPKPTEPT